MTREARRKSCFLGYISFSRIAIEGQNVPIFKKKCSFWILLGALRGHFSNVPKNIVYRVKLGAKNCVKFSFRGVFRERANLD